MVTHIASWLHNAIANYNFRLRLPEEKRNRLDALVLALQVVELTTTRQLEIHKEIEEILNTGVGESPAGKAVADAAKKGFDSHFDGKSKGGNGKGECP